MGNGVIVPCFLHRAIVWRWTPRIVAVCASLYLLDKSTSGLDPIMLPGIDRYRQTEVRFVHRQGEHFVTNSVGIDFVSGRFKGLHLIEGFKGHIELCPVVGQRQKKFPPFLLSDEIVIQWCCF